jgi:hypothetical protein
VRMNLGVVTGLVVAAGLGMGGGGRAPSVDMVSARYGPSIPAPAHLGHWDTPVSGQASLIAVQILEAGTGAGEVRLEVMHEGVGLLCEVSAPCTSGVLLFQQEVCPENTIPAGARLHLAWSHTCTTPPHGNAVFGFEWSR